MYSQFCGLGARQSRVTAEDDWLLALQHAQKRPTDCRATVNIYTYSAASQSFTENAENCNVNVIATKKQVRIKKFQ